MYRSTAPGPVRLSSFWQLVSYRIVSFIPRPHPSTGECLPPPPGGCKQKNPRPQTVNDDNVTSESGKFSWLGMSFSEPASLLPNIHVFGIRPYFSGHEIGTFNGIYAPATIGLGPAKLDLTIAARAIDIKLVPLCSPHVLQVKSQGW